MTVCPLSMWHLPGAEDTPLDTQIRNLGLLFGTVLLLHGLLDPLLTYVIVQVFDVGSELNPILRGGLERGLLPFVLVHVPLFLGASLLFWLVTRLMRRGTAQERTFIYTVGVLVLLAMILWGVAILLWNLSIFATEIVSGSRTGASTPVPPGLPELNQDGYG